MAAWFHTTAASTMLPRDAPEAVAVRAFPPQMHAKKDHLTLLKPESTKEALIYGFLGSFLPLAFATVCLRLYSRWRFTHIGKDDILMVMGLVRFGLPWHTDGGRTDRG